MRFREGDSVMHWSLGLGKVIGLEKKDISGKELPYYAVKVGETVVWVPVDEQLDSRLRHPVPYNDLKKLKNILTAAGEPLPDDRQQRKLMLTAILRSGTAEALCRVVRSLTEYQKKKPLNENDKELMERAQKALTGELSEMLEVSLLDADMELKKILAG